MVSAGGYAGGDAVLPLVTPGVKTLLTPGGAGGRTHGWRGSDGLLSSHLRVCFVVRIHIFRISGFIYLGRHLEAFWYNNAFPPICTNVDF